jgi:hypothetical protein
LELSYFNLDSALRSSSAAKQLQIRSSLAQQDQRMLEFCFPYSLSIPLSPDSSFLKATQAFYSNTYFRALSNALDSKKKWRLKTMNELIYGFKALQHFLPKYKDPSQLVFANTRFTASAFCTDKSIVIGQERYLGATHSLIESLPENQFYRWIKEAMEPQYAAGDALLVWMSSHVLPETTENYASEMLRWGKLLYLLKVCLPETPEATIVRYSASDWKWALASEHGFWQYLVESQLLYKTDEKTRMNLLHEGPFTIGLPKESPDRMGRFMGYRIVCQYMENQEVDLQTLLQTPYHQILQKYEVPK